MFKKMLLAVLLVLSPAVMADTPCVELEPVVEKVYEAKFDREFFVNCASVDNRVIYTVLYKGESIASGFGDELYTDLVHRVYEFDYRRIQKIDALEEREAANRVLVQDMMKGDKK